MMCLKGSREVEGVVQARTGRWWVYLKQCNVWERRGPYITQERALQEFKSVKGEVR